MCLARHTPRPLPRCSEALGLDKPLSVTDGDSADAPKLNESADLPPHLEPDPETLRELGRYYRPHNERLFKLIGRDLGWHSDERYWWYS